MIFVFGSNLAGRHGACAALYARNNHGAVYGQGVGLQGSSYAIPTKDEHIKTLPLDRIEGYVRDFIKFACEHTELTFNVTPIGTGRARIPVAVISNKLPFRIAYIFWLSQKWHNFGHEILLML